MKQTTGWTYGVYLLALIGLIGGMSLSKGGLFIDRHEGDVIHLIEIVLRMARGDWPHLDFVTPLGVLAFAPIAALVQAGYGIGTAIVLAQIGFALVMVPAIWWLAHSRFGDWRAYLVGATIIVLCLALIHGGTAANVSLSMHYNRWAWALAFVAILLAVLPSKTTQSQVIDGLLIGGAMAFFILGKITYGVAFAPGLLLALVLRRQWTAMGVGAAVVVGALLAMTVIGGFAYWQAYLQDLLLVSTSGVRPRAGVPWASLILSPAFAVGNLAVVAAILLLRKGEGPDLGLMLIVFFPGFLYVTLQNYGNDPKWFGLVALILAATHARSLHIIACVMAALIAPSFYNMATSPLRHLIASPANYTAVIAKAPHDDLFALTTRVNSVVAQTYPAFEDPDFAHLQAGDADREDSGFLGQTFPHCRQELGLIGSMQAVAADLDAEGLSAGKSVFATDILSGYWLFGELIPTVGGAPWYYGDLTGLAAADYLLIPACPTTPRIFRDILKSVEASEFNFKELRRTELYTLYERF